MTSRRPPLWHPSRQRGYSRPFVGKPVAQVREYRTDPWLVLAVFFTVVGATLLGGSL